MKTLAFVFCYQRFVTMQLCCRSLLYNNQRPELTVFIDDGSDKPQQDWLKQFCRDFSACEAVFMPENHGLGNSARIAFDMAHRINPEYLFLIESDYIFRQFALDHVLLAFEKTEHGRNCLGIAGHDDAHYYSRHYRNEVFPGGMKRQMGQDNVNRGALYREFDYGDFTLQLVSNTCFSSFLRWRDIQTRCQEFPELAGYLERVINPQIDPDYPAAAIYAKERCVDDGLLSHSINLVWNRWAIKHGVNRETFGAWLNLKPGLATNAFFGGMHP
jgi:hypothetical protein